MKKACLILFSCLLCNSWLMAQESPLSLQQALEIGLKNNYSIQISKTSAEMAQNNNTYGNAGFLPNIGANASYSSSSSNSDQKYSNNTPELKKNNVGSTTTTAGLALGWTLFDGMKMFATKQRLEELQDMGDLTVKIQLENTISGIILAYHNIVYQKLILREMNEMISLSEDRMKIAEKKFNVGSSSKQEYLQAKVDLNAQQSALIRQQTLLRESMINLNGLMASDVDKTWEVADTILISYKPVYADLKKTIIDKNTSLIMAQKNIHVADLSLKEINSLKFPKLGFSTGYSYSRVNNQIGLTLLNQNIGSYYGFTFSFPLYNGHVLTNQVKNAKLNILSAQLENSDISLQVQANLLDAFENFQSDLELFNLEKQNILNARENLDVAMESYKLGSTSSIDLMNAQKSYSDAVTRMLTALYVTKVDEVALMKLNGELVQ